MPKYSPALSSARACASRGTLRAVPEGARAPGRLTAIDGLRGVAVVLMLVFHGLFDLHFFCTARLQGAVKLPEWFLTYIPDFIGGMFLTVVGISAWLAHRARPHAGFRPFFLRGLRLACLAAGMNDHVTKPIDAEGLIAVLKRWSKK